MPARAVWRVRDRASFTALRQAGRRVRRGPVTVVWSPGSPGSPPRVAYAVARSAGPATARNRIRRRLRAVVTDLAGDLRPGTYLLSAGAEAAELPYGTLRAHVVDALGSLPEAASEGLA